jgi:hypothetical protein
MLSTVPFLGRTRRFNYDGPPPGLLLQGASSTRSTCGNVGVQFAVHVCASGSGQILSGLSALRRNNYDSGPLQDAAKAHASEITELERDLAYKKPNQAGGRTEQEDRGPDHYKDGEGQNQQRPDAEQGAHHEPCNKTEDENCHLFHHNRTTCVG